MFGRMIDKKNTIQFTKYLFIVFLVQSLFQYKTYAVSCSEVTTTLNCSPGDESISEPANELIKFCFLAHQACEQAKINALNALPVGDFALGSGGKRQTALDSKALNEHGGILNLASSKECIAAAKACNDKRGNFDTNILPQAKANFNAAKTAAKDNAAKLKEIQDCDDLSREKLRNIDPIYEACRSSLMNNAIATNDASLGNLQNAQSAGTLSELLKSGDTDWTSMAAIGAMAALPLGVMMMNKKKEEDKKKEAAEALKFDITPQASGGQCLSYSDGQQRCYTNDELAAMCTGPSVNTSQISQGAAELSAMGVNAQYNQQLASAATTNNMKNDLCVAFNNDIRPGGGSDPETCHTHKEDYFKAPACKAQMISQCQDSDAGDCAAFNQYYCFDSGSAGSGSNYCGYKTAKQACNSSGTKQSCPACLWTKSISNKFNALNNDDDSSTGLNCLANMNQIGCYPEALTSREAVVQRCTDSQCTNDPVCENVDNPNFFYSWRNPGTGGSSSSNQAASTDLGDGASGTSSSNQSGSSSVGTASVNPEIDCTQPDNFATESCRTWYCSFVTNQSSPNCIGVVSEATVISGNGPGVTVPLRYPAGTLSSDIDDNRTSSLIAVGSRSVANNLCDTGQLYDCGALEGLTPGQ